MVSSTIQMGRAGLTVLPSLIVLLGCSLVLMAAMAQDAGNDFSDFDAFVATTTYRPSDVFGIGPEFAAAVMYDVRVKYALSLASNATTNMIGFNTLERSFLACRLDGYLQYCDNPFGNNSKDNTDVAPPYHADFMVFDEPFTSVHSPDVQNYPLFVSGIAPVFNVPGLDELILDRQTLAKIFRGCSPVIDPACLAGSITHWNDSAIKATNPSFVHPILDAAGPINVIVQSDHSPATEAFKSALCTFESAFRMQIGKDNTPVWNGTRHTKVQATINSISYVRMNMVTEVTGVTTAKILNRNQGPVAADSNSLLSAFQEIGLMFGNDGSDPSRQTVDLTGANGDNAWPIASLAYLVIRKEWSPENCTERRLALLDFIEYMYTNQGSDSPLFVAPGFAPLTTVAGKAILQLIRNQIECNGVRVYQDPAKLPVVELQTDESLFNVLGLLGEAFTTAYSSDLVVDSLDSHLNIQHQFACFANPTCQDPNDERDGLVVLAGENLSDHIIKDGSLTLGYNLFTMPYAMMATGFVINFCLPEDLGCRFKYKNPFVLDIELAAAILDMKVKFWNDSRIQALNPEKLLPNESIIVVAGPKTSNFHFSFVENVRSSYMPNFAFTGGGLGRETYWSALVITTLVPYTITFAPFNGSNIEGTSRVALVNRQGRVTEASVANIEACASDSYVPATNSFSPSSSQDPNCYPLVEAYTLFTVTKMRHPVAAQLAQYLFNQAVRDTADSALKTRQNTIISVSELGTLVDLALPQGQDMQMTNILGMESIQNFDGDHILLIQHDLTLIPDSLVYLMYTLLAIELFIFASLAGWVVIHRNRKLVRNSSPVFMLQVLVGAAIMASTVIPLAQQDSNLVPRGMTLESLAEPNPFLDGSCVAQPVLFSLGFFVTFSALFLKSWRLIRIFNNKKLRNLFLRDGQLLAYQVVVIVVVVILNMLWALRDPLVWIRFPAFIDTKNNLVVASYGICYSRSGIGPALPLLIGVMLVLVVGNYLSYLGRRIPTEFNESKWTAMSMVVTLEAFSIGLPILMLANSQPVPGFIIKAFCSLLVSGATVCLIFLPKVAMAYGWGLQPGDSNPWRFVKGDSGSGNQSNSKSASKKLESVNGTNGTKQITPSLTSLVEGKVLVQPVSPLFRHHNRVDGATASSPNPSHSNVMMRVMSTGRIHSSVDNTTAPPASPESDSSKRKSSKKFDGVKPAEALAKILQDDPMRRRFRRYLQTLKMAENVRFWDALAVFRSEPDAYKRYVSARAIIQTFVADSAPLQVNLSSKTRGDILTAFANNDREALGAEDFFHAASNELFEDLRQSDAFRQFLENDTFSHDNLGSKSDPAVFPAAQHQ